MLSRSHRFHGLNSLRGVYKHGQTVRSQQLTVRYGLNTRRSTWRCAVVISKKIEKSAVKRNRIRRRIFEVVRLSSDKIQQPYDIVISVFSSSVIDLPAAELNQQINDLLKKATII